MSDCENGGPMRIGLRYDPPSWESESIGLNLSPAEFDVPALLLLVEVVEHLQLHVLPRGDAQHEHIWLHIGGRWHLAQIHDNQATKGSIGR